MKKLKFRKYVIFKGFERNELQIRIQREKLRISAPDEILTFFDICFFNVKF